MTKYQRRVLAAVQRCPGAGPCNVCDFTGGMEPLDLYNAGRALERLTAAGWLHDGYVTEKAERYLSERKETTHA